MVGNRAEPREPLGEAVDRFDPLAENDRLLPARLHFLELGLEPFELRTLTRGRVEVADLLQTKHEFEDVLDRRGLAQ